MRTLFFLIPLLAFAKITSAQSPTQTVKGQVLDKDTGQPLIGATVEITDIDPTIGVTTDVDGNFELTEVPVGRRTVQVQYLGYEPYVSDGVIVNSAKELVLNIQLIESVVTTETVVVNAFKGNEPLNELAIVSTRSFSVEETQRYAASANDPGRMAMGLPGVQPTRDTRSDIVIRGNSPVGLLWRLNGIDIPNPNHFARRGSSGGGITIFSISMLNNSDFSTGAFPAEYGNAFSGVFDVKFRRGNREQREYTFRAGLLGLDFSTEGPIKQGKSSYLVNYRYSTLGILNDLGFQLVGERVDNTFQDLSFNLHFDSENGKVKWDVWGIGGLSEEIESAVEDLDRSSTFSEYLTRDFTTNMGAIGVSNTWLINEKSYFKNTIALMGQEVGFRNDTINVESGDPTTVNDERYVNNRLSYAGYYSYKFSPQVTLKAGAYASQLHYDLRQDSLSFNDFETTTSLDTDGNAFLLQPWFQFRYRPNLRWTFNVGLHSMFFTMNNTSSVEPRLGIQYLVDDRQTLSFAYGLHSRIVPIGTYFTQVTNNVGNTIQPNEDLELIKSHHLVLAYDYRFSDTWRFHAEAYFQRLFDVPVAADSNNPYYILNDVDGYAKVPLVSAGVGRNIGLDLSIEKAFETGTFFLLSGSIFNSEFKPLDKSRWYNTQYNNNFVATFMGGKEWGVGDAGTIQASLRVLYGAGQRLTPLLDNAPVTNSRNPPLDTDRLFEERIPDYFRPDLRFAYRKDNPKSSWWIALDIQNTIGRRNLDGLERNFDPDLNEWVFREQSGLTPILSFQIDF